MPPSIRPIQLYKSRRLPPPPDPLAGVSLTQTEWGAGPGAPPAGPLCYRLLYPGEQVREGDRWGAAQGWEPGGPLGLVLGPGDVCWRPMGLVRNAWFVCGGLVRHVAAKDKVRGGTPEHPFLTLEEARVCVGSEAAGIFYDSVSREVLGVLDLPAGAWRKLLETYVPPGVALPAGGPDNLAALLEGVVPEEGAAEPPAAAQQQGSTPSSP